MPTGKHAKNPSGNPPGAKKKGPRFLKGVGKLDYPRRGKGDRPDTRQILVVIRHKRIAVCEEHDEPKYWAKRGNKEGRRDLPAASGVAHKTYYRRADLNSGRSPTLYQHEHH